MLFSVFSMYRDAAQDVDGMCVCDVEHFWNRIEAQSIDTICCHAACARFHIHADGEDISCEYVR